MNFKKLNERLEKYVINELSFETKKSYLAKKQDKLDKAQAELEKAKRLVRDTEEQKTGKRKITDDQVSQLLSNIEKEFPKWEGRYFYKKMYGYWGQLSAGDPSENDNSCQITLSHDEKYLFVRIEWCKKASNGLAGTVKEKFSLDDFNFFKLNNKVLSFVKNFMKKHEKEQIADNKLQPKLAKSLETLKKLLSRIKSDQLDSENNKFDKKVAYDLTYSNVREMYPAVKSVNGVTLQSTQGYENDYQIKAVGLTKKLTVGIFYWTERYTRIDHTSLENAKATIEDKIKVANKLIDILKGQTSGRSNLKSQEKQLEANKELAAKAIEELKDGLRKVDRGGDWDSIKKESWGYTFSVRDWGEWGDSRDWEEDNDFMNLQDYWYDKKQKVEQDIQTKYPTLKISVAVGEKRYLDCSVSW